MEVYVQTESRIYRSEGFDSSDQPIWVSVAQADVPEDVAVALAYDGPTVLDLIPPGFVGIFDSWGDYSLQDDAEVNHG